MTAAIERRRPAVPVYPLAAVPAATCARVLPGALLRHTPGGTVVHALAQSGPSGGQPVCRTRVRRLHPYAGEPLRMCTLCATALGFPSKVQAWQPTRGELAEVHMAEVDRIAAETAERIAQVRSAAIEDGSALLRLEQVPAYRLARNIPEDAPVPPLHATYLVGEALTPVPVTGRQPASSQHYTDVLAAANQRGRDDRIAARQAARAQRDAVTPTACPHCGTRDVRSATDHATGETVLVDLRLVDGGRLEVLRAPGADRAVVKDYITRPAPRQPGAELHARTCPAWPAEEPVDLDDDVTEKSGGWRR